MANEFMEIMQLMNNGINNDSTLKDVYPRIVNLGINLNKDNIDRVTSWMLEEECLSSPHPGLNEAVLACNTAVTRYENRGIVR